MSIQFTKCSLLSSITCFANANCDYIASINCCQQTNKLEEDIYPHEVEVGRGLLPTMGMIMAVWTRHLTFDVFASADFVEPTRESTLVVVI